MEQFGASREQTGIPTPRDLMACAEEAARACGSLLLEAWRRPKSGYEEKHPGE